MGFFKRLFGLEKDEGKEVKVVPEVKEEPVVEQESYVEPEPATESEPIAEPEPIVKSEPIVESEIVAEPEPITDPEPEPGPKAELVTTVEPESEPAVKSQPIAEEKSLADPELIREPESEPEPKEDPVAETESPIMSESVVEPEPELEPEFDVNSILNKETYYSIAKVRVQGFDQLDEDEKDFVMNDLEEDMHVYLRNEFDNPKDCHALEVLYHGHFIGYIDKKKSELIHSYLREGKIGAVVVSKVKSKDFKVLVDLNIYYEDAYGEESTPYYPLEGRQISVVEADLWTGDWNDDWFMNIFTDELLYKYPDMYDSTVSEDEKKDVDWQLSFWINRYLDGTCITREGCKPYLDSLKTDCAKKVLMKRMESYLEHKGYHFSDKEIFSDDDSEVSNDFGQHEFEQVSLSNFFGVNIKDSPNGDWLYMGESDGNQVYRLSGIDKDKYVFDNCAAQVKEDGTTDFYFMKDYSYEDAQKVLFMLERTFGEKGIHTFEESKVRHSKDYRDQTKNIEFTAGDCEIVYLYMKEANSINVCIKTPYFSDYLNQGEKVYEDRIVTSRGFNVLPDMIKYNAVAEATAESVLFFVNEDWNDGSQPILMVSMLIDGELTAFNLDTHEIYFKYSCPELEKKLNEGYNAILLVTDYKLEEDGVHVELYAQFIEAEDKPSHGEVVKQYATTYELDYIDGQDHHQRKVIKNANMNSFVAGIKYRDNYEELLAKLKEGMELQIKPEPDNEFDPDALAVYNGDDHLGYIPKKDIPAVALNMEDDCAVAEIDYVDEEHVDLVIPVSFNKLSTMSDEDLEGFRYYKTERVKYENGYQESSSPISKEEFLDGIRQQRENL